MSRDRAATPTFLAKVGGGAHRLAGAGEWEGLTHGGEDDGTRSVAKADSQTKLRALAMMIAHLHEEMDGFVRSVCEP